MIKTNKDIERMTDQELDFAFSIWGQEVLSALAWNSEQGPVLTVEQLYQMFYERFIREKIFPGWMGDSNA